MKIELIHEKMNNDWRDVSLLEYEGNIEPLPGDIYAGSTFKDGYQRKVLFRMILTNVPNKLLVYVTYSYPNLVTTEKELNTISEMDLVTEKS